MKVVILHSFKFSVKSIFGAIWEKGLRIKGTIGYNDSGCTFVPNDGDGCTHIKFKHFILELAPVAIIRRKQLISFRISTHDYTGTYFSGFLHNL